MSRSVSSRARQAPDAPSVSGAKGSINLRIEGATRQLIDEAADLLGKTRTQFMIDSARSQAIETLLDRRFFALDDAQYSAFVDALDDAPMPGTRLKALLGRNPAWNR